jgi:fimbrial chaperone protein
MGDVKKGLILVLGFFLAKPLQASKFSVNPVLVELGTKQRSANLFVTNDDSTSIRIQIELKTWDQNNKGESKLTATKDLIVFPSLMIIEPKVSRTVRIGSLIPPPEIEKAYRINVREIPASFEPPQGGSVRFLTEFSIPIFVQPNDTHIVGTIETFKVKNGTYEVEIHNKGKVHFQMYQLLVQGEDAQKNVTTIDNVAGWYILPGGQRTRSLKIPQAVCRKLKSLKATVTTAAFVATWNKQIEINPADCGK